MFRKVQLKFFAIITGILVAIFIAVLGSVNLIMDAVMERQSKVVLKQIAEGVEYDADTNSFNYFRGGREDRRPDDMNGQEPPPKPEETGVTSTSTATSTSLTTTSLTATTAVTSAETEQPSEEGAPEDEEVFEEVSEDEPEQEQEPQEPPQQEVPQEQPASESDTVTPQPSTKVQEEEHDDNDDDDDDDDGNDDDDDDKEEQPWFSDPWGRPGNGGGNGQEQPDDPFDPFGRERDQGGGWGWGQQGGGFFRTSYKASDSVIVQLSETEYSTEETASAAGIPEDVPPDGLMPPDGQEPPGGFQNGQNRPGGQNRNGSEPVPKSLGTIDFFILMADTEGTYLATLNNDEFDAELGQEYITAILSENATSGMAETYQFYTDEKSNGTLIALTDKSAEIDMLKKLTRTTVIIGLISVILLSAAAFFLSGLIVRPIREAFDKQKQFISDASHELKTPLTVISTNADVLEGEIGENKWLKYIQSQAERMNVLVNDLLSLTRLENKNTQFIQTEFNLSQAIANTALPFECQAFETNKNFVLNIEEGISITGSEMHIKQMAAIFIDNALKYSKEAGTVRVSLVMDDGKPVFSVYNTGTGVKEEEKDKIFERFYRSDSSRSRATGGYGLGLAIAKSIIDKHKFKIYVDNAEGKSICFIITMQ